MKNNENKTQNDHKDFLNVQNMMKNNQKDTQMTKKTS